MSDDANKVCVRRQFEELWNKGQFDRIDDFFAKDFMNFGQQHQKARRSDRMPVILKPVNASGPQAEGAS
jgi:hypothetical protein